MPYGEIKANSKIKLEIFKNPLFKSSGAKFGTKHPSVDEIQILTGKGPHSSSRGHINKIIKIY